MRASLSAAVAMLVLMMLVSFACSKRNEVTTAVPPAARGQTIMEKVSQLLDERRMDEALELLEQGLSNPAEAQQHGLLFASKLQLLIHENPDDAMVAFQDAMSNRVELADMAYGVIESWLEEHGDHAGMITWTEKTIASRLAESNRSDAYLRRIRSFVIKSDTTNALLAVSQALATLSGPASVSVISPVLESAFMSGSLPMAESIIGQIGSLPTPSAEQKSMFISASIRLLGSKQEWEKMQAFFAAQLPGMENMEAVRCYNIMVRLARQRKANDVVESLQKFVMNNRKPDDPLFIQGAREWVSAVCDTGDAVTVLQRVEKVMERGLSRPHLATFLRKPWYAIFLSGAANERDKMMQILEQTLPEVKDEDLRGSLLLLRLDGYFIKDDLDGVIAALKQGIPAKDEAWHKTALIKAEGHKAIKEGRNADAVEQFRKFIELIAVTDSAEQDPETGCLVKTGWIVAKNTKRIGALLAEDGKKDEAMTAYKEAMEAYKKVLEQYKEGSIEQKAIKKEMESIPSVL